MQSRREESDAAIQFNAPHTSPMSDSDVSNPVPVDINLPHSGTLLQEATGTLQSQQETLPQKSSRLHEMQQSEGGLAYLSHQPTPSNPSVEGGRITQAVTSTILPEFRAATSQSHLEAHRYVTSSNASTYSPTTVPQAPTAHYAGHYSLYSPSFPGTGSPMGAQTHYNSHLPPQLPSQRPLNFSVNHLIQRQYPKM